MPKNGLEILAIASEFPSIGSLIRHFLECTNRVNVAWEARTAGEALPLCQRKPPAVLIISPSFPDMSAPEFTNAVREKHPSVRVLLFATNLNSALVHGMITANVHGIVSARSPLDNLVTGISVLRDGGCYFDPVVEPILHAPPKPGVHLTDRENSVLRLVAEGFSTKEIADKLGISFKTVDKFRSQIMQKLDLHDAVKLTHYAIRAGICPLS